MAPSHPASSAHDANPPLGVLMLQTRFPRIVGDIGNSASFGFPVRYAVVQGASAARVVRERASGLLQPFIGAAQDLIAQGCGAIGTSCGFLALFQRELQEAVPVPVAASSLLQVAPVQAGLAPGKRVGIITIAAESLSADHLRGVGADPDTPVMGVRRDGEFARAIMGDLPEMDTDKLRAEVLEAGERLLQAHPEVAAFVLECTNMPPYARALAQASGLPVYDVLTLLENLPRKPAA
jgi:Asp/Glu/hydantoin racemase